MSEFKVPKFNKVKSGQILEAQIVDVKENVLLLDVKDITEGTLYLDHYDKPAPTSFVGLVKLGDTLKVQVTKRNEGDDSAVILLSRLPLLKFQTLDEIESICKEQKEIEVVVKSAEPKGLILDYKGLDLFLPYSLLDFDLVNQKDSLKGQKITVVIAEFKRSNRANQSPRIIASRKPIFERAKQEAYEARQTARQKELDNIQTGDVLEGTVEKIEDHAAHVKFETIMGMLRISQVSHYRIEKIADVLTVGQKVSVKVIKKEGNRLDLSMKALEKTPFEKFCDTHKVGDKVTGKVVSKLPFGMIIELERDVKGLLHKNEYTWNPRDNFDAYIKIDDEFDVVVLSKDVKKQRIALSRKAIEHNPWLDLNVKVGQNIEVRVAQASKDGLNIEFQGVDGFIPASEVSIDRINPADHFAHGDTVKARVTDFNRNEWILKLSIRRILESQERAEFEKYLKNEESNEDNLTIGDLFDDFKK